MIVGKKLLKHILIFIIVAVVVLALFYFILLSASSETTRFDDITDFEIITKEARGSHAHIPDANDVGEYESIELVHKKTRHGFWIIDSLTLMVRYDSTGFDDALDQINAEYSFLKETNEALLDCYAIIDGYEIQVVDKAEKMLEDYLYDYPKCFLMIGVNEQEQSIIYMYHYDSDLDYIKDLDVFVNKYYVLK